MTTGCRHPKRRLAHRIAATVVCLLLAAPAWAQSETGQAPPVHLPPEAPAPTSMHVAIAPATDAADGLSRELATAIQRTFSGAHFLSQRFQVRVLDHAIQPVNLAQPKLTEALARATGDASFLIWPSPRQDGGTSLYLIHLYALDPGYQSRQAAGSQPIVPVVHRLPDFTANDPLKTVYAILGIAYARLNQYTASHQALSALNNFEDLSAGERFPVVFFLGLANLVTGFRNGDAGAVDQALYHFEALRTVMQVIGNPELVGATLLNRGLAYQHHPTRRGGATLDLAIAAFETALPYYKAKRKPVVHARILHHLASAEQRHPDARDGVHLNRAILAYRKALKIWDVEQFPEAYRSALHNMALCFQRLPVGDRNQNLLTAVKLYQEVLKVPQLKRRPDQMASSLGNLGQAFQSLPPQPDGRNLLRAISAYREALRYWDPSRDPHQFGRLHQLTGQAFQTLLAGDRRENLSRAAHHFEQALSVTPADRQPMPHALLQVKRGAAYAMMPGPGEQHSLARAREAFSAALDIITPDNLPYLHAKVVKNLETVTARLSEIESKGEKIMNQENQDVR